MSVTVYKTIQGDMWDTISYRLYGTGNYMHRLMEANPAIADVWVFGGGVIVVVPEIVVDGAGVKLPPWKRGTGKMLLKPSEDFLTGKYIGDMDTEEDIPDAEEYIQITSANGTVVWADSVMGLQDGETLTIFGPFELTDSGYGITVRRGSNGS